MQKERDEQVIFIKDLIFAIVYKWRAILVVAIALAMLLGGYQLATGLSARKNTGSAPAQEPAAIVAMKEEIRLQQQYLSESLLMNFNPYQVYKATTTLSIVPQIVPGTENADIGYASALVNSYVTLINNTLGAEATATATGIPSQYLSELVEITTHVTGTTAGTVIITVTHSDAQTATQIAQLLTAQLADATALLNTNVAPHSISCYTACVLKLDSKLVTQQSNERKRLDELQTNYTAKAAELPASSAAPSKKAIAKKAIIFAVIGGFLGVFATAGIVFVTHFCSTKVYSARTLHAWTGIKVLGCAGVAPVKCPVDRWLRKLEGRATEEQLAVTTATVRNYCKPEQTLLLCMDSSCPDTIREAFAADVPGATICGTLTTDVAALKALPTCANVLLVARCGKTHYRDIAQQIQLIEDQNKELIGCIVLE